MSEEDKKEFNFNSKLAKYLCQLISVKRFSNANKNELKKLKWKKVVNLTTKSNRDISNLTTFNEFQKENLKEIAHYLKIVAEKSDNKYEKNHLVQNMKDIKKSILESDNKRKSCNEIINESSKKIPRIMRDMNEINLSKEESTEGKTSNNSYHNRCLLDRAQRLRNTGNVFAYKSLDALSFEEELKVLTSCNIYRDYESLCKRHGVNEMILVKPLLILDLNGFLCTRTREYTAEKRMPSVGTVAGTKIIPRVDLSCFLFFLDSHFTLAVWTSAQTHNAHTLVDLLFPLSIRERLLFIWGQSQCDAIDINTNASPNEQSTYDTIVFQKSIEKVWQEFPLWSKRNSLLIDDSPEKIPSEFIKNAIHPTSLLGILENDAESLQKQRIFFQNLFQFFHDKVVEKDEIYEFLQEFANEMRWNCSRTLKRSASNDIVDAS